jgi:hypothetical protein
MLNIIQQHNLFLERLTRQCYQETQEGDYWFDMLKANIMLEKYIQEHTLKEEQRNKQ